MGDHVACNLQAAREHGAEMDEPQFEAALREVAGAKPQSRKRDEKERKPEG